MLLLAILLIIVVVALAIWWLQRQERQTRLESVERSRELPPLAAGTEPDFSWVPVPGPRPATPAPAAATDGFKLTSPKDEPAANLWQDQVKQLKDKGELEPALVLCQQHFPKYQAFQQAAILLRLQMKQLLDHGHDLAPPLARLYRCAVLADLFRSGAPLKPANPRHALKGLASIELPYLQVGYRHLKLLSKSDTTLLEKRWGQPAAHQHAEAVLGSRWESLCH